ncbi:hypothetical protein Hte_010003 [Hypoxylon texense]
MAGSPPHTERPIKIRVGDHARCWKNCEECGFLEPAWPSDLPDESAILQVARQYIPWHYETDVDSMSTSNGAFHRIYRIPVLTSPGKSSRSYIMRLAIPVEPFYKTESEVATMFYLREQTSIPVPAVVAWSSSAADNVLGFEWILMETVDGVTLESVWYRMGFEDKKKLTEAVASYTKELLSLRFTSFGSIYFAEVWNEVNYSLYSSSRSSQPAPSSRAPDANIGKDGKYVIGRMVSLRFFQDKRALMRADRGPFETAKELVVAEANLLGQRIRHLSPTPGTDYYCEVDENLYKHEAEMLQVFDKLEKVSARIFSDSDGPEDLKVLWHNDLSTFNILVDPITFEIKGIVDWESVSIVPAWEIDGGIPYFLRGPEVDEPPPLGSRSEEDEAGLVEIRKDWDLCLLRKTYTEIVGPIFDTTSVAEKTLRHKRQLLSSLATFEDLWVRTKNWLKEMDTEKELASGE